MWKQLKRFFTDKLHHERVNVNHPEYLEKNLKRVDNPKHQASVGLYSPVDNHEVTHRKFFGENAARLINFMKEQNGLTHTTRHYGKDAPVKVPQTSEQQAAYMQWRFPKLFGKIEL